MPVLNWVDAALRDFPKVEVTREMVEQAAVDCFLYPYCGVRYTMGKLMTTKEIEHRRIESMKPLYDFDR
jgi:hypothetical protein